MTTTPRPKECGKDGCCQGQGLRKGHLVGSVLLKPGEEEVSLPPAFLRVISCHSLRSAGSPCRKPEGKGVWWAKLPTR